MSKISDLPVLTDAHGGAFIPVVWNGENMRIYISTIAASPTNFAPYEPDKEYSNAAPDFVSYNGNVYQYIFATPATGVVPTNTSNWRIVSAGQFAHIQNTDLGTSNNRFSIQRNSQNQDIDGITILDFGTQQGGKVTAIGLHWYNDGSGDESYELKICYDYTASGPNVWEDFGLSDIQKRKIQHLPTLNSPDIEILVAPTLYKNGSLLAATSGSVKYQGTTYAIPAVANISGGIAGFDNKQFFAIAAYNIGTDSFQTTALFATTIGGNMPEKLPMDNQAYLGLYQYTGGVLSELPFNYVTSVVFPDGSRAVANAKGELPMPATTTGGTYNLTSPTTVAVGSMPSGTDITGLTWQEIVQYMTTGSIPVPPVSSASASPVSDTEIEITWTI